MSQPNSPKWSKNRQSLENIFSFLQLIRLNIVTVFHSLATFCIINAAYFKITLTLHLGNHKVPAKMLAIKIIVKHNGLLDNLNLKIIQNVWKVPLFLENYYQLIFSLQSLKLFSFKIDLIVFKRISMCYTLLSHQCVKKVKLKQCN